MGFFRQLNPFKIASRSFCHEWDCRLQPLIDKPDLGYRFLDQANCLEEGCLLSPEKEDRDIEPIFGQIGKEEKDG